MDIALVQPSETRKRNAPAKSSGNNRRGNVTVAGTVKKPKNPFKPKSIVWALMEEDWSDLTLEQIAEVFDSSTNYISKAMQMITKFTGYVVPHVHKDTRGRPINED